MSTPWQEVEDLKALLEYRAKIEERERKSAQR
jgi:hypothetical protein